VDPDGESYKKNAALFYGAPEKVEIESQGSIFQKNAAAFYGTEAPPKGERPFKIQKPTVEEVKASKGFSVLNENRLKEHVSISSFICIGA